MAGTVFDPAAQGWIPLDDPGFANFIGPFWQRQDDRGWSYAFLAEGKHVNRNGIVHGGMLLSFADQAMGMTAWHASGNGPQATMQLSHQFVDAVAIGDFVEARCTVLRASRKLVYMACTLVVGERTVGSSSGVWKLIGRGQSSGSNLGD
jgi:acyl-coenzyme A thioesterase PaaI-like protein